MKILTKEEEAAHYNATLKGGSLGGAIGLAAVSHSSFHYQSSTTHHAIHHLFRMITL